MTQSILEQEEEIRRIEDLSEKVYADSYKIPFWVSKNIFGEVLPEQDAREMAKTAVFEALFEEDSDDDDVIKRATRIYKSYFWGKGTACYDSYRRATTGVLRTKNMADLVPTLPWGEELEVSNSVSQEHRFEIRSLGDLFELIADHAGPEVALVFVLRYSYDWSVSRIVRAMLGCEIGTKEYIRETQRLFRLLSNLEGYFKDKI